MIGRSISGPGIRFNHFIEQIVIRPIIHKKSRAYYETDR